MENPETYIVGSTIGNKKAEKKICDICHKEIIPTDNFTTGYGIAKDGSINCYKCCAEIDKAYMKTYGKITLYLSNGEIINWPGTLRIPAQHQKIGRHNIAGKRYDVWFRFDGKNWHGVQYGDNTQLCHCKQLKS